VNLSAGRGSYRGESDAGESWKYLGETTTILNEVDAAIHAAIRDVNTKIAGKPFIIITE
jgi:hypothetical protein